MTRTTRLRRMILQLRQIFFTEGCTRISVPFYLKEQVRLLRTEHDAGARQVVGSHLYGYLVSRQDTDIVHPHLARNMPKYYVSILELDPESCVRQSFQDFALHLDGIFFRHLLSYRLP